jgi:hypothetical protein
MREYDDDGMMGRLFWFESMSVNTLKKNANGNVMY